MEIISAVIRNIIIFALIFSCMEMFLPKGELSRFVRLSFGIIMLALAVIPLLTAINDKDSGISGPAGYKQVSGEMEMAAADISMILKEEAMNQYEREAAADIAAAVCLAEGIENAEAALDITEDGRVQRLDIRAKTIPGTDGNAAKQRIREILQIYFSIPQENINIALEEG